MVQYVGDGIDRGGSFCASSRNAYWIRRSPSLAWPSSNVGRRLCRYRRRDTCVGARNAWEFTRMSFETFALIWPILSIGTVVVVMMIIVRLQDRAERRNSR